MTAFEWIALVGAAAWLPQIGVLVYRWATKPKITVVPVPEIEVGYNWLGPIVNIKAALFSEQKDALVLNMTLVLRHQSGKVIRLVWHSFVETFSEMRARSGESTEISRDQVATALRLSTAIPTEKLIRFQDPEFQNRHRLSAAAADEALERLKKGGGEDTAEVFLRSKEYADLTNHFRHGFCWEAGTFDVQLEIDILGRRAPAKARSTFSLSEAQVDQLGRNAQLVMDRIEKIARGAQLEDAPYHWATPRLASKDIMVKK